MTLHAINVDELHRLLADDNSLCLIDVREPHEWLAGHIPQATHIPKDRLLGEITQHIKDKDQTIYLICRSGNRSGVLGQALSERGHTSVYNVEGGIMDWAMFGYPLNFQP